MRQMVRRFSAVAAAALAVSLVGLPVVAAGAPAWSHRDARVCAHDAGDSVACQAVVRQLFAGGAAYHARTPGDLDRIAVPAASTSYTAVGIRTAYGITGTGDPSRVIAIVDAYDAPDAAAHLAAYRTAMGLPTIANCTLSALTALTATSASPCFAKVNQTGGTTYPAADAGWATEVDLDLQAASAVCPMCSILLLEGTTSSIANLGTAVTTASNTAHVVAISNSYGTTGDLSGATYPQWDNAAKKGIAVTVSTGDNGYGISFPASSTYALAVGGTTLTVDASGARMAETAWSGAGSGCSTANAAPSWQVIPGSPCGAKKATADVSAVADPGSGLQIYTTYSGTTGWWIFGGTSLSAPIVGTLYAMQGGYNATTLAGAYAWAPTTGVYDVTSGSNGACTPAVLCTAGVGWDGPTGRGSISLAQVVQTLTSVKVTPATASVVTGATLRFTATAYDQNGAAMATQPTFTWAAAGGGTIDATGLFTATGAGGPFAVTATTGAVSGSASVTVTAPAADFSIAATPASQTVKRGGSVVYTVAITRLNGFVGGVSWTVTGAPTGAKLTWSANPATGATATLTVATATSTSAKAYTLTIKGTSGSLSRTTTAGLTVTK